MSFDGFVKRTAYWADDYVHGKKVRRFYDDLKKVHKSYETGYPIQQEHLNEVLTHATTYSPYYKKFAECNKGGELGFNCVPRGKQNNFERELRCNLCADREYSRARGKALVHSKNKRKHGRTVCIAYG